jgi:hypothetical protein
MIKEIENKVNDLLTQVMPNEILKYFLELSLRDKLIQIFGFAYKSDDVKMMEFAQKAINYIEAHN